MRFQAITTELVFEHALRIRMKADTEDSSEAASSDAATAAVGTPVDNASQLGPETVDSEDSDADVDRSATASASTTAAPASNSSKGKGKSTLEEQPKGVEAEKPAKKDTSRHLVGRINNLVTSDLNNIDGLGVYLVFIGTLFHVLSPQH